MTNNIGSSRLGSGKIIPSLAQKLQGAQPFRGSLNMSLKSDSTGFSGKAALRHTSKVTHRTTGRSTLNATAGLTKQRSGEVKDKQANIPEQVQALMKEYKIAMKDLSIDVASAVAGAECAFGKAHKGMLRGRPCECRVLKFGESNDSDSSFETFLREVVVRCELKHRCLRTFLGISTFPGYSIVLGSGGEWLTLDDLLQTKTFMGLPQGLSAILKDVASALAYVHDAMGPHCSLGSSVVRVGGGLGRPRLSV